MTAVRSVISQLGEIAGSPPALSNFGVVLDNERANYVLEAFETRHRFVASRIHLRAGKVLEIFGVEASRAGYECKGELPNCCPEPVEAISHFRSQFSHLAIGAELRLVLQQREENSVYAATEPLLRIVPRSIALGPICLSINVEQGFRLTHQVANVSDHRPLAFKRSSRLLDDLFHSRGRFPFEKLNLQKRWSENSQGDPSADNRRDACLVSLEPKFEAPKVRLVSLLRGELEGRANRRCYVARDCPRHGAAHDEGKESYRKGIVLLHGGTLPIRRSHGKPAASRLHSFARAA
ncbi:putative protein OS=Bosea thiooxidans OX=53254 GN=SAMN05660750_03346 PE=4 SV=1 [Bosea thiooxidans]|uniref:Uncharacterized protein n=1 Tax=Bosea thiooxidans TaxID=53254 RepID=A0A1T5FLU0_9HYPH|nr:hypothetical protein SAMN05660750_03346 [Bosea thiooxidans]